MNRRQRRKKRLAQQLGLHGPSRRVMWRQRPSVMADKRPRKGSREDFQRCLREYYR